jgi:hypothetical protein
MPPRPVHQRAPPPCTIAMNLLVSRLPLSPCATASAPCRCRPVHRALSPVGPPPCGSLPPPFLSAPAPLKCHGRPPSLSVLSHAEPIPEALLAPPRPPYPPSAIGAPLPTPNFKPPPLPSPPTVSSTFQPPQPQSPHASP